jgi:hypothetical protein
MAVSHVELYEALKGPVGEKAARMIADIVPPAADVARRQDVFEAASELRQQIFDARSEFRQVIAGVQQQIADARAEAHALNTRTIQWILGVTIPLWIGTWGMMAAILLRGT